MGRFEDARDSLNTKRQMEARLRAQEYLEDAQAAKETGVKPSASKEEVRAARMEAKKKADAEAPPKPTYKVSGEIGPSKAMSEELAREWWKAFVLVPTEPPKEDERVYGYKPNPGMDRRTRA
jgi:type II secretory pathway component PulC